ncbi:TolC family protein [Aquifex sp.]
MKLLVLFPLFAGFLFASQLEELIKITKENNIFLKSFENRIKSKLYKREFYLSLPNPELRFTLRNFDTDEIFPRKENPMGSYSVGFSQKYPLFKKRFLSSQVLEAEAKRERALKILYAERILLQLKERYYELLLEWERERYLRKVLGEIKKLKEITEEKYTYGRALLSDILFLKAESLKVETRIKRAIAKRKRLEKEIHYLLGKEMELRYEPLNLKEFPPIENLEGSPYVALKRTEAEVLKRKLKRTGVEHLPDLRFFAEYSVRPWLPDLFSVGLALTIPLYYKKRERFLVLEASEMLRAKLTELRDTKLRVKESLEGLKEEYELLMEVLLKLEEEIETKKKEIEALLLAYQYDRTDIREVLRAYRILWNLEIERYSLVAQLNKIVAKAEELL